MVIQPQEQQWGDRVPPDFDWQTYVSYHPKLRDVGIASEAHAREHYATAGRHQRLVYKRLDVTMRYTACTGEGPFNNNPQDHLDACGQPHLLLELEKNTFDV